MRLRDRFFSATTAKAILSWRLLAGAAAGVIAGLLGVPWFGAILIGAVVYVGSVALAMPKAPPRPQLDPFALSEPWRQFVQGAQRSKRQLADTVRASRAGPLRDRLQGIVDRLDHAIAESWQIARRGDEIDAAVRGLDPTRLRSRLDTLKDQSASAPSENVAAAIVSVESQLASADRLKALSASTADQLRLTQARLDELVSRAAEVSIGADDTADFAHDVDDLVVELEGLRLAVQELPQ
jgi:hypothetical protein